MMRIVMVDGNNLLYRILRSKQFPELISKGRQTGPLYGFFQSLHRLAMVFSAHRVALVFDGEVSSRRRQLYPEYKTHADPTPEVIQERELFRWTLEQIRRFSEALSVPLVELNREADDVLYVLTHGIIARVAAKRVVIVSQDLDLVQIVGLSIGGSSIELYQPIKDRLLHSGNVREELGYDVAWYAHYKAMVGKNREVPGLEGVGEGTAREFLSKLAPGDNFRGVAVTSKNKRVKRILTQLPRLELGVELSRLDLERFDPDEELILVRAVDSLAAPSLPDYRGVKDLFREFEFASLLERPGWANSFIGLDVDGQRIV